MKQFLVIISITWYYRKKILCYGTNWTPQLGSLTTEQLLAKEYTFFCQAENAKHDWGNFSFVFEYLIKSC